MSADRVRFVTCPRCGRDVEPREVVYGLPDDELLERAGRGEVSLGGCDPTVDGPVRVCPRCEAPLGP